MSKTNQPKFVLGDMVEWTSQANGNSRTKIGIIVKHVPAHWGPNLSDGGKLPSKISSAKPRTYNSYLVVVPHPEGPEYFWPRATSLKKAKRYLPAILTKKHLEPAKK